MTGGPAATLPAPIVCVGFPVLRSDGTVRALPVPSTLAAAVESAWLDVLGELLDVGPVTVVCLDCHGAPASRAVSLARQLLECATSRELLGSLSERESLVQPGPGR